MTPDEIKVGDRLHSNRKFLVVGRSSRNVEMGWICRDEETGAQGFVSDLIVHTCQRLPPEIGVGDEVSWTRIESTPLCTRVLTRSGTVTHVGKRKALIWSDKDQDEYATALSDLTLVKKAEKD